MKKILPTILIVGALSFAEETGNTEKPWSVGNKLATVYTEESDHFNLEWTLTLAYELGMFEISLENVLSIPDISDFGDEIYGEVTLGASTKLHQFISAGISATLTYWDTGTHGSIAAYVTPAYTVGPVELSDKNKIAYHFEGDVFVYTNTFTTDWTALEKDEWNLMLKLENEAARALKDGAQWEDFLTVGPIVSYDDFSLGLFYHALLHPDVIHGVKITLGHSF